MGHLKSVITLVLLLFVFQPVGAQWTVIGSSGISAGGVTYTSLEFDSNDDIYICYRDFGNSSKATVRKYNGSSWSTVGSAGFSSSTADYTVLDFDNNDTPYVAFSDYSKANKSATVMKFNGTSWDTVGNTGFSAGEARFIDFRFDDNSIPYIAYRDVANSDKATVMKYNGSNWVMVGSAGFSAGQANDISIRFDQNDTPYVCYKDYANGGRATVMKFNGTSWVTVGSAGFTSGTADYTSIEFDSNGDIYMAYRDGANSFKATVMKYSGGTWSILGSAGFTAGQADFLSFVLDSKGVPYVAYRDGGNSSKLSCMKYNGSNWVNVGSPGFTSNVGSYTDIEVDQNDVLHGVYRDDAVSGKATVGVYPDNVWNGSTWSNSTPDSNSNVSIESNTAPTSFTCNDLTIASGFALNTGTNDVVTIYGSVTNNGDGVSGTGTLTFSNVRTANLLGDTLEHEGTVIVEGGSVLNTNSLLRLTSDASNTGRIGESDGTISGNVYVQRYMPGKRCFRFYGHPFSSSIALSQLTDEIDITGSGGASNGFTTTGSNNPSAFYFDVDSADNSTGVNPGWQPFTSANSTDWDQYELLRLLVRGAKGEGLTGGSYTPSAATFEGVGAVNQGTQVITLTKGSNSTFVGCGNPFPSPVEMDKVTVGSNVGANYYAWDATSGASGAYVTNAWTLPYDLPAYAAFFTNVSANSNNTLIFEEADKVATGASLFKTNGLDNWVELYIYDSTTKWDRLLINFNTNSMEVEDQLDGKKLYNPNLDFFTLSKDDVRMAVDVRPYKDNTSIPLGLTAYNRYNKYVIRTGMFNIPAGAKLYLNDKLLNKKEEIIPGMEYWFDVTADTNTQGINRFEINMVGTPTNNIANVNDNNAAMQLIPNPAYSEVKISFKALQSDGILSITSLTGQVLFRSNVGSGTGSRTISLTNIPKGMYIVELKGENASFVEKLIKH